MKEDKKKYGTDEKHLRSDHQVIWSSLRGGTGKIRSSETVDEAAIVLVATGIISLTVDGKRNTIREGELCMIPPNSIYHSKVLGDAHVFICRFQVDILLTLKCSGINLDGFYQPAKNEFTILKMPYILYTYLSSIKAYLETESIHKEIFELKRQELFTLLFAFYSKEELIELFSPVIDESIPFRSFVTKNWIKARNVEELAEMANLSKSGFRKKFKKYFNDSPYRWMLRRKAESVLSDIYAEIIPLKEIAEKYNFASYSHFGVFCRAQYGVSPAVLLKQSKKLV